jgi:hypothetical protein
MTSARASTAVCQRSVLARAHPLTNYWSLFRTWRYYHTDPGEYIDSDHPADDYDYVKRMMFTKTEPAPQI